MSSSSVWVQLYYEGKDEPEGSPEQIYESDLKEGRDWNVASLKGLVKDKLKKELDHAGLTKIVVYPPDTDPERTSIRGDKVLQELIDELGNKNPPVTIDYDHPLIVLAPDTKQGQQGSVRLTETVLRQVWRLVLRLENMDTGDMATGLVFDVFKDEGGLFMLLLMNLHFKFTGKHVVRALGYDADSKVSLVEAFRKSDLKVFKKGKKEEDFVIYRLDLDENEWEMPEPGWLQRRTNRAAPPAAVAAPAPAAVAAPAPAAVDDDDSPKRKRRRTSGRRSNNTAPDDEKPSVRRGSERLKKNPNPNVMKRAEMVMKTPRYRYEIYRSMPVFFFGFPHTSGGRWEGTTTITSIDRLTFGLQMLSANGLSGGAVIATEDGEVVGIMGGNLDSEADGKPQPFNAYGIQSRLFPLRPSSNPPSPS